MQLLMAGAGMKRGHAVLVLPAGAFGAIADESTRRWLSRGRVAFSQPDEEMLCRVVRRLGVSPPRQGLAALRLWGQSGVRPDDWLAAADPVHLETRLRELRVRAIRPGEVEPEEHEALIARLQSVLGGEDHEFVHIGNASYIRAATPFVAPTVSAAVAEGHVPDRFLPSGPQARVFHRLQSEVQMLLHDDQVNRARVARGDVAMNSLWIWGAGQAPACLDSPLPRLYSDDPLFSGLWASAASPRASWPGALAECLEGDDAFVATLPEAPRERESDSLQNELDSLRRLFERGEIRSATLFFRDGLHIQIRRLDRLRVWRASSPHLGEST